MKVKERFLIFSDLDGTLLTDNKKIIPFRTKRYLKKLAKNGHIIVLASGRPLQAMMKYIKELKLNHPVVSNNGGIMFLPNNPDSYTYRYFRENVEAYDNSLDKNIAISFLNELDGCINCGYISCLNHSYIQNPDVQPMWLVHPDEALDLIEGKFTETLAEDPLIITIYTNDYNKTMEVIKKYPHINYEYWHNPKEGHAFDIFKANASKGFFINEVCKIYNINPENTISFGDQLNDISMFKASNISVAMKNSRDEVSKVAKFKTTYSCNDEGVYKFLKSFFKNYNKN